MKLLDLPVTWPAGWLLLGLGAIAALTILIELILRIGYGLGRPPLYVADQHIGYLLAPNQNLRRFGHQITINDYSMRADAIAPLPASDTLRIFLLGDSLANGNWWTDQPKILSARIAEALKPALTKSYSAIEAINASANSWGPRNELAYLERYGTFGASVLVLLLNTDDLFGTEPTPLQVGRDTSYPDHNPPLAIFEVLSRLKKTPVIPELEEVRNERGDRVGKNLTAVNGIYQNVSADGGKFVLVLSPLKRELAGSRDYELAARQRLKDWATENNVPYLDLIETYRQQPEPERLYRDHIHLSPAGDALVGKVIAGAIAPLLNP
ncbi:MAG: SGNH/GDSL hydrolase family protein [Phormidesmis sp.]